MKVTVLNRGQVLAVHRNIDQINWSPKGGVCYLWPIGESKKPIEVVHGGIKVQEDGA